MDVRLLGLTIFITFFFVWFLQLTLIIRINFSASSFRFPCGAFCKGRGMVSVGPVPSLLNSPCAQNLKLVNSIYLNYCEIIALVHSLKLNGKNKRKTGKANRDRQRPRHIICFSNNFFFFRYFVAYAHTYLWAKFVPESRYLLFWR